MKINNLKEYSKEQAQKIVKLLTNANVKEVKGEGDFEVVASTEGTDREGESILAKGWQTENYMKNPVILLGHDYSSLPIGAATEVIKEADRLIVRGKFASTEEGQKARKLYDDGILRAVSVGFIPVTRDGNIITTAELLEVSFVAVPCNPEAGSTRSKKMIKSLMKSVKMAIPFSEGMMAPEDQPWDESAAIENVTAWSESDEEEEDDDEEETPPPEEENDDEVSDAEGEAEGDDEADATEDDDEEIVIEDDEEDDTEEEGAKGIDFNVYKEAFAYVDDNAPEDPASYKMIHHDINENDEMVVVWLGVMAAMGQLLSEGNGGIPEDQVQGVYNHLAKHYEQFGKEAPELKKYTDFELEQMFGDGGEEKTDEEAKELVDSIMKRLEGDVNSLVASAKLQVAEVIGEIKRGVKPTGMSQKAGRTLSAKTRTAIKNAADSCSTAAKDLKALLVATDSPSDDGKKDAGELLELARSIDKINEKILKKLKGV